MKINITKVEDNNYVLELQSGHFKGKLGNISDVMIDDLIKMLVDIKNNARNEVEWVWNPRSHRHEKRIKVPQEAPQRNERIPY